MNRYAVFGRVVGLLFSLLSSLAVAETGSDHPIINRFPGAEIDGYDYAEYDELQFILSSPYYSDSLKKWTADKVLPLEGQITYIRYRLPKKNTPLQVFRNYQKAVKKQGMDMLFECDRPCPDTNLSSLNEVIKNHQNLSLNGHLQNQILVAKKANVNLMLFVNEISSRTYVWQFVVEQEALNDDLISPIALTLAETGRIDLYGFYFDSGKAELKPESNDQLAELGQILLDNPKLKLNIIGHTDNVGDEDANAKLSASRAQSVKNALINDFDIAHSRLVSSGQGESQPLVGNNSSEGRAKNRRVEIVALNPEVLNGGQRVVQVQQQTPNSDTASSTSTEPNTSDNNTAYDKAVEESEKMMGEVERVTKLKDKFKKLF